jgi:hypothetical protein
MLIVMHYGSQFFQLLQWAVQSHLIHFIWLHCCPQFFLDRLQFLKSKAVILLHLTSNPSGSKYSAVPQAFQRLQLICCWTLSTILSILKKKPVLFLKKTQRFGDWILSPKRCFFLRNRTGFLRMDKMVDNVQQHINCNNLPSSQTFRSHSKDVWY